MKADPLVLGDLGKEKIDVNSPGEVVSGCCRQRRVGVFIIFPLRLLAWTNVASVYIYTTG